MSPSLAAIGRRKEQIAARRMKERRRAIEFAEKRSQKEGYSRDMGEDVPTIIDGEFCIDGEGDWGLLAAEYGGGGGGG